MQQLFTVLTKIVYYACFDVDLFRFDIKWRPVSLTELGNEEVSVFHLTMNTGILTKEEIKWVSSLSWFLSEYNLWTNQNLFFTRFSCTLFLDDE